MYLGRGPPPAAPSCRAADGAGGTGAGQSQGDVGERHQVGDPEAEQGVAGDLGRTLRDQEMSPGMSDMIAAVVPI